jgi:hypothetical protein
MRGADVQRVFEAILPDKVLMKLVQSAKFQQRARKLDALRLLRAMIVAAATGYGGRQADVMRLYFKSGASRVVRGVLYGWFGKELEAIMVEIRALALAYAGSMKRDLPGLLGAHVTDWHIVDSTAVKLDRALIGDYLLNAFLRAADGTLWVGTSQGLRKLGASDAVTAFGLGETGRCAAGCGR